MDWQKFDTFLRLYEFANDAEYHYEKLHNKQIRYVAEDKIFGVIISVDINDIDSLDKTMTWSMFYRLVPNASVTAMFNGSIVYRETLQQFYLKYIEYKQLIAKWEKKLPKEIVNYEHWNQYNKVFPACPRCNKDRLVLDSSKEGYIRLNCTNCNLAIQYELIRVARYPIIL